MSFPYLNLDFLLGPIFDAKTQNFGLGRIWIPDKQDVLQDTKLPQHQSDGFW